MKLDAQTAKNYFLATFNEDFFENDLKEFSSSIDVEYFGLQKPYKEFYEKEGKTLNFAVP